MDNRGEPTFVVKIIKAFLELALYEAAFGEDLLGVGAPLPPSVAHPVDRACGRRDLARQRPRRRVLGRHAQEQQPLDVPRL
eukprot:5085966-Pyramimonas_sp.AAC.1